MVGGLGILMEQMVKLRAGGESECSKPQRQHETGNGEPSGFALTLSRNHAVAILATVGKSLRVYDKSRKSNRRIGSPNSDRVH